MNSYGLVRSISVLALGSVALTAQVARKADVVPLKNWTTPLYWSPSQGERTYQGATPQIQFSANAVSTTALIFVAITPCRLVDTRGPSAGFNGIVPFSGPSIAASEAATFPVQSAAEASGDTEPAPCGVIPAFAQAYSLNLTVVPHAPGAVDYVSMWPASGVQPFVATLNDPQGAIAANAAIVPAGTPSGGISVFNAGPSVTDIVIDMNGYYAAPTDAGFNTAVGSATLASNTTGYDNTASGAFALQANTSGYYNTASGYQALFSNTIGFANTATGRDALANNTSGTENTGDGAYALQANTTGVENTASGYSALSVNTTGDSNTAIGGGAMVNSSTGSFNTAVGGNALDANTTGTNNIAIGFNAANTVGSAGSNNIHIGSLGTGGDNLTIRIGLQGTQTNTFIAGIDGETSSGGVEVFINGNGQLGTLTSSRRFKEQITDMGDRSNKLFQLRPVNFYYKPQYDDGSHLLQYGLIAEEVAQVYPEMVAYGDDGQIQTVRYQMLAPMLLNEVQKQAETNRLQQEQNRQQAEQIQLLKDRLAALENLLAGPAPVTAPPDSN